MPASGSSEGRSAKPEPPFQPPAGAQPLATRMRPRTLDEFVGQEHLVGEPQTRREGTDKPPTLSGMPEGFVRFVARACPAIVRMGLPTPRFEVEKMTSQAKVVQTARNVSCRPVVQVGAGARLPRLEEMFDGVISIVWRPGRLREHSW